MRTRASEYARSSAMLGAGVASTAHTERTDIHVHLPVPLRAQERASSYLIHRLGLGRCRGGRSGALFRHAVGAGGGICPARAQWRRRRALGQPQRRANGSGISSKFAKSKRKWVVRPQVVRATHARARATSHFARAQLGWSSPRAPRAHAHMRLPKVIVQEVTAAPRDAAEGGCARTIDVDGLAGELCPGLFAQIYQMAHGRPCGQGVEELRKGGSGQHTRGDGRGGGRAVALRQRQADAHLPCGQFHGA